MKDVNSAGVILRLSTNDRAVPVHVFAPGDPALPGPEVGFAEERAAQRGFRDSSVEEIEFAIVTDSLKESQFVRIAILPAEKFPSEVDFNESIVSEEPISGDRVERVLEPEE